MEVYRKLFCVAGVSGSHQCGQIEVKYPNVDPHPCAFVGSCVNRRLSETSRLQYSEFSCGSCVFRTPRVPTKNTFAKTFAKRLKIQDTPMIFLSFGLFHIITLKHVENPNSRGFWLRWHRFQLPNLQAFQHEQFQLLGRRGERGHL